MVIGNQELVFQMVLDISYMCGHIHNQELVFEVVQGMSDKCVHLQVWGSVCLCPIEVNGICCLGAHQIYIAKDHDWCNKLAGMIIFSVGIISLWFNNKSCSKISKDHPEI